MHSEKEEADEQASLLNESEGVYEWGTEEIGPENLIEFLVEEISLRGLKLVIIANYESE